MSLSKADAAEQLREAITKAGVEITSDIDSIINEQLTQKVVILGKRESRHEMMCDQVKVSLERIIEDNKEKLGLHTEKLCEIIENTAPTPEAKQALQTALAPTKAKYLPKEKIKTLEEALDMVQDVVSGLGTSEAVRGVMGDANAEILGDMTKKMNDQLERLDQTSKQHNSTETTINSEKSSILLNNIGKMQKFVENAEKQASKGKFGRIMNVLKSALKVIGTLGLSKKAKLEFSAAKFMLDNKNAEKIKDKTKIMSNILEKSGKATSNIKKANLRNRRANSNKGMGR